MNGQRHRIYDGPRVKPNGPPGPKKSRHTRTTNIFSQIRLASWNVRTLSDANTNRQAPERRSALVAKELQRLNIDIAGLSECRVPCTGEFIDGDYSFLHSGRQEDQPKLEGVAIAIKSSLRSCVISWKGLSSRIMTARLALTKKCHATIISVYAPTFKRPIEEKNQFYDLLAETLDQVPCGDRLLLVGDFNARVGSDTNTWPNVVGNHGFGAQNEQGLMLLQLCARFGLSITNTLFQHKDIHKGTWQHPRSKQWHMIDHIIVNQHHVSDVLDSRVRRSADCWTDHKLMCARLNLKIHTSRQKRRQTTQKRLNTAILRSEAVQQQLAQALSDSLTPPEGNAEQIWSSIRSTVYNTAKSVLGTETRSHRGWFNENDDEILTLLSDKYTAFKAVMQAETLANRSRYREAQNKCQRVIRQIKNARWSDRANEIEEAAKQDNTKRMFDGIKLVSGRRTTRLDSIDSADGIRLTQKENILNRWKEHFATLLNQPSNADLSILDSIPPADTVEDLDAAPTIEEISEALKQLSSIDAIPAEVLKQGGPALLSNIHQLFLTTWDSQTVPQDFRDGTLVKLYKKKNKFNCGNYRGIILCYQLRESFLPRWSLVASGSPTRSTMQLPRRQINSGHDVRAETTTGEMQRATTRPAPCVHRPCQRLRHCQ